jgi:hypothetical protein
VTVTDLPSLPGILSVEDIRRSGEAIARVQTSDGSIPWFPDGHTDAWDHVENAMALLVAGERAAAERAYDWLARTQRDDGSWPMKFVGDSIADPGTDANMVAYVAVGVWHHWRVTADEQFLFRSWPTVERALDRVVALQLPFGGIAWAAGADGQIADSALVTGSSSIYHALLCGIGLANLLGRSRPEWENAAGRLGHALRVHEERFDARGRHSMDWYYPVLGGAVRGSAAVKRMESRWEEFVVPDLGVRCVSDRPWVTGAETCELALSLHAIGDDRTATDLVAHMQHLRDPDGSYWTGYVFADGLRWPVECSTWTAAAVVLAVDAISETTGGAGVFRGDGLPAVPDVHGECGCVA